MRLMPTGRPGDDRHAGFEALADDAGRRFRGGELDHGIAARQGALIGRVEPGDGPDRQPSAAFRHGSDGLPHTAHANDPDGCPVTHIADYQFNMNYEKT